MIQRFKKQLYDKDTKQRLETLELNTEWQKTPAARRGEKPSLADIEKYQNVKLSDLQKKALVEAQEKYKSNQNAGLKGSLSNKPWFYDSLRAAKEKYEQDHLVTRALKE